MKPKNILLYIQTEQTTIKKQQFFLICSSIDVSLWSIQAMVRYAFTHIYHVAFANNIFSSRHQGKNISN